MEWNKGANPLRQEVKVQCDDAVLVLVVVDDYDDYDYGDDGW